MDICPLAICSAVLASAAGACATKSFKMMSITKLQVGFASAMAIAAMAVSLMVERRAQLKLGEEDESLRQQSTQLTILTAEHQRLSNLLAGATGAPTGDQVGELQRLCSKVEGLRKQNKELERVHQESRRLAASQAASEQSHPPEYWQQLHQRAGGKPKDAVIVSSIFLKYAREHQGQFPSSFDQVAPYLLKEPGLTGTNEFEIVYRGSLEQLTNVPLPSVAVIRDRQSWQAPSGKMAKVYGMVAGIGETVESDDNFQTWEAEHIIAPSPAEQ